MDSMPGAEDTDGGVPVEIERGMMRWEPGSLDAQTVECIAQDALADIWRQCDPQFADGFFNRQQQIHRFREKLMELIRITTGESMRVI